MRAGSSERLVARRAQRGDTRARLTRYLSLALGALLAASGGALLFLVPLYADPALAALAADFDPAPALCETSRRLDRLGLDNCTWASCREGCTSDAYRCTQLHVRYRPAGAGAGAGQGEGEGAWRAAVLLVNTKGCGYPPAVDCANFTALHGRVGARYPCYWSRADAALVVPGWSRAAALRAVVRSLGAPLLLATAAAAGLCALHCRCRARRRRRRVPPRAPPAAPLHLYPE